MKTPFALLFTSLLALSPLAQGDSYHSLFRYLETIEIPAGQTGFVVSATPGVVLGFERSGAYPVQVRFAEAKAHCHCSSRNHSRHNLLPAPSLDNPVPIAGPVKLVLRTSGMVTLSLPEQRRVTYSSSEPTVRRFAKN